jgi:hypothetical protein
MGSGVTPLDVQRGSNNRLWVLTGAQHQFGTIRQIDATTGGSTGPNVSGMVYGGRIRTTLDGKTLTYGDFGLSPSDDYQFDVSGTSPSNTYHSSLGGNGMDVSLSKNGGLIAFMQGGNAQNPIIETSSHLTLGVVGPANSLAFSPDSAFAYTGINQAISIYNLTTYLQTGTINTVGAPEFLFVDNAGSHVFSDEISNTQIYATGRSVPEPSSLIMSGIGLLAMLSRRRRAIYQDSK